MEFEEMVAVANGWLQKQDEKVRKEFINTPKERLIGYHTTLGRSIRNEFKLWDREWKQDIRNGVDHSEDHPDQISMRVIKEVWRMNQNAN